MLLVALVAAFMTGVLKLAVQPVTDVDAWLHLRIGRYLLDGGRFTGADPWGPLADRTYRPTQWLPEVVAAWVEQLGGLAAVADLRLAGILGLSIALLVLARTAADSVPAIIATAIGLLGTGGSLSERPQMLSFIFLALTLRAWWQTLSDGRPRWWLAALTWLWACCHGLWIFGLAIGIVMVLAHVLDDPPAWRTRLRLLAVPALSTVAVALTPLGPKVLSNPFEVAGSAGDFVQEWQASSVRNGFVTIVVVAYLAVLVGWSRAGSRVPWTRIALTVLGIMATLWMGRLVAVGAIIVCPLLAESLQTLRRTKPLRIGVLERRVWGVGVAAALMIGAIGNAQAADSGTTTPRALDAVLATLPPRSLVLTDQAQSGWLIWSHPQLKVTLDLRSEIYSKADVRGYLRALDARPGWEEYVNNTGARFALVPVDWSLRAALESSGEWSQMAQADGYTLLAHN